MLIDFQTVLLCQLSTTDFQLLCRLKFKTNHVVYTFHSINQYKFSVILQIFPCYFPYPCLCLVQVQVHSTRTGTSINCIHFIYTFRNLASHFHLFIVRWMLHVSICVLRSQSYLFYENILFIHTIIRFVDINNGGDSSLIRSILWYLFAPMEQPLFSSYSYVTIITSLWSILHLSNL